MIEFDNVTQYYDDTPVLSIKHLYIESAKTTVLLGQSGCGKSTLLRLIAGLLQPGQGVIRFEGTVLAQNNIQSLRHQMGYVIQEGGLFPHLTATDNVTIMAQHLCWSSEKIQQRLKELTELVRLPRELLTRFPNELSGGQRQRVSLMRALMLDPKLLLLDEPLGALDPMIRYELQQELLEIFRTLNKTVVLVTHDISEAAFFSDTIVLLRQGHVVQQGTMKQLIDSPTEPFVEDFINAQRKPIQHFHQAYS